MKKNILKNSGVQSLLASLLCVVLGLLIGYVVLLFINPNGAGEAISAVMKNFLTYSKAETQAKYLGNTLVKTAPLLMCSLSILFAYKVGLFNIGVAGQYCFGVALSLYAALAWGWGWLPCMLLAMLGGALLGAVSGLLKSYCNVNEVISGIMLNWIILYVTNMLLTGVKEETSPYTFVLSHKNAAAVLPSLGLGKLFNGNQYVGLAIPLSVVIAVVVWVVLEKTRFGYELRATGNNKNAAKYCGMAEKRNIILTLAISGALAGMGAAMLYLTGYEQWQCSASSAFSMLLVVLLAAALAGTVYSSLLAVACINFKADQTIVGTALNMLGTAGATVIVKAINTAANPDDVSSTIQYAGAKKAFLVNIGSFEFSWFMLVTVLLLIAAYVVLYKTRFGLRLMACGEHPQAADSVGINVYKMRWAGVLISGMLGGLGGIVFITAGVSEWRFEYGVAGFGFLSLAVMIFGQWKPTRIALAALLFGLFRALSNVYAGFEFLKNLNLPSPVYNMMPYIISLVVLAFTSKKSRAPKAEGIPYDKGQR